MVGGCDVVELLWWDDTNPAAAARELVPIVVGGGGVRSALLEPSVLVSLPRF